MRARTATWMAGALLALDVLITVVGLWLLVLNRQTELDPGSSSALSDAVLILSFVPFAVVGALILSRQPRNRIGWIFLVTSLGISIATTGFQYAVYAVLTNPGSLPWGDWAARVIEWGFQLPFLAYLFLFLLFPTGHLPSRRWLPVAALAALAVAALEASEVSSVVPFELARAVAVLAACACATAPLVRYRSAGTEERQQIKWFTFAAVPAAAVLIGPLFFNPTGVYLLVSLIATAAVAVAAGIAIFKYRLYEIDLIINKTLVYGALAAFITAVYVLVAVVIGTFVGATQVLSLVATAIVAVAFQPIRRRVEDIANRIVYGDRATPYQVMAEFSRRMGETFATEEVPPRIARILGEGTGAARADVWVRSGPELHLAASWPDGDRAEVRSEPLSDAELPHLPGVDAAVPVHHQGELLGALAVTKPPSEPITEIEEKLVADLAAQAGFLLRNVRLIEELRASRQRLVSAQDEERRRIERDLHDGAQQHFVAIAAQLGVAESLARTDPDRTAELISTLRTQAIEGLDNLRDLAHGIYPPLLADRGLEAALRAQAAKIGVPASIAADSIGRYPAEVEAAVYFCCLEALQNAAKYAQATSVVVRLERTDGALTFSVADDGVGFRVATTPRGAGTTNMADRLDALGGMLEVRSSPGRGTTVSGRVPARATPSAMASEA